MGKAVERFAKSRPTVRVPEKSVRLPVSADEYYREPAKYTKPLYEPFGAMG